MACLPARGWGWRRTWPWMLPAALNECCLPRNFRTLIRTLITLRAPTDDGVVGAQKIMRLKSVRGENRRRKREAKIGCRCAQVRHGLAEELPTSAEGGPQSHCTLAVSRSLSRPGGAEPRGVSRPGRSDSQSARERGQNQAESGVPALVARSVTRPSVPWPLTPILTPTYLRRGSCDSPPASLLGHNGTTSTLGFRSKLFIIPSMMNNFEREEDIYVSGLL